MFKALLNKGKEIIMYVKLVEKALELLERMAEALEQLAKPRVTCASINSNQDPPTRCLGQIGHSGMHSNADGSIRW